MILVFHIIILIKEQIHFYRPELNHVAVYFAVHSCMFCYLWKQEGRTDDDTTQWLREKGSEEEMGFIPL